MNNYTLGQKIRFTVTVKDETGAQVDPGGIVVSALDSRGILSTPASTRDGVGLFHFDYEPTDTRIHSLRVVTTNPDSAAESQINVLASWFLP